MLWEEDKSGGSSLPLELECNPMSAEMSFGLRFDDVPIVVYSCEGKSTAERQGSVLV